ncbi:TPA: hypothetical protein N0F65_009322 [Lagenidium giganteum]|uniref:Transposase n=1 Tax=Lagenidium giganteum TaxID=4803 RepID=A0AAV2YUA5_9STRA|nr:TPA: hypothetical protein N0F65_009322 [Lagenidium giganteum]
MLQAQAVDVSRRFNIPEGKFVASHVWQKHCRRSHKRAYRCRTHQGQQSLFAANEATAAFAQKLRDYTQRHSITRPLNADQTAAFSSMYRSGQSMPVEPRPYG